MMTLAVFAMQVTVGVPAARRAADIDERFFYRGP
ncbi:MAG: hypothetical protein QG656_575, partial [Candidatus Hydrogenedentes bacterium]|nr:hypothetical protein [Candidatus Hydrogenedentota bacterium]